MKSRAFVVAAIAVVVIIAGVVLGRTLLVSGTASAAGSTSETYVCPMHPDVVRDHPADCPMCGMDLVEIADHDDPQPERRLYVCPMHPDVISEDRDAGCPVCGMNLEEAPEPELPSRPGSRFVCPMHPDVIRSEEGSECPICGMHLVEAPSADGEVEGEAPTVRLAAGLVQTLGVRTAKVERRTLKRSIDAVGYVEYDRSRMRHIYSPTEGNVENLAISSEGERVRKGESLFQVFSPMLGTSYDETFAHQDGYVVELDVIEGSYVRAVTKVLTLADLSSVWVLADVFEHDAAWVRVGQEAEVRLAYVPGRVWKGRVQYVYPNLDPVTRTLKVRLRFANRDEVLRPNMHAEVTLYGDPRDEVLAVPRESVIITGSEARVIRAMDGGRFRPERIATGLEAENWIEITEGLAEGDEVVVSGQFLIDSEASLRASLLRMTSVDDGSDG